MKYKKITQTIALLTLLTATGASSCFGAAQNGIQQTNHRLTQGELDDSLLQLASENNPYMAHYYLRHEANVNATTTDDFATPLHRAVKNNDIKTINLLLAYKADVNAQDIEGLTPLHLAAERNHHDVIQILLQHGAHIDAKSKQDYSPLHYAANTGSIMACQKLIWAGADIETKDKYQHTPLDHSIYKEREQELATCRQLILFGEAVESENHINPSIYKREKTTDTLIAHGASNVEEPILPARQNCIVKAKEQALIRKRLAPKYFR
jgi:ankyrin repeat protein